MQTSPLSLRLADEIIEMIRDGRLPVGGHLNTLKLADQFGVSRSPIRGALQVLTDRDVLEQQVNRGFFVKSLPEATNDRGWPGDETLPDEAGEYQRFAHDWLTDQIPAEITEQFLRTRYKVTKAQLADMLLRAAREGWAERKTGYGWRLLPVAKTVEAFEQIYRFRMLIEPAAMLEPTFRIDRTVLAELRNVQENMLKFDISIVSAERLLHNGSAFHEEIIKMSGNPFFYRSLIQVNRMRRLLEYRAHVNYARLRVQCTEHLEILSLLDRGDLIEASYLLRRHLSGALSQKSPIIHPPSF